METKEKRKEKIGKEIRALDHILMRHLICQVKKFGLDEMTVMHGWIIVFLYNNREQVICQKDIEREFSIGRSTVTNILKLMEKKGYICREAVAHDNRLKRLVLQEKGMGLYDTMQQMTKKLDADTTRGISDEELDIFFRVISKIKKNLQQEGREAYDQDTGCAYQRI